MLFASMGRAFLSISLALTVAAAQSAGNPLDPRAPDVANTYSSAFEGYRGLEETKFATGARSTSK